MRTAVYPGTFDPLTLGHGDVIQRASQLFDKLLVAVAASPRKQPLFTLAERIELVQKLVVDNPKVQVIGFDGLLVDLMQQQQAQIVVRGVRGVVDFEYEVQLAQLNQSLLPQMESIFLPPAPHLSFIAASLVREVASLGGKVDHLVYPWVAAALQQKFTS